MSKILQTEDYIEFEKFIKDKVKGKDEVRMGLQQFLEDIDGMGNDEGIFEANSGEQFFIRVETEYAERTDQPGMEVVAVTFFVREL